MHKKFIDEIEEVLKQQKKDLEKSLDDIAKKSTRVKNGYEAAFPQYGTSEEESADEVSTFTDRISLGENLENRLQSIELALKKIQQNKYGICEECGKNIDDQRLKVMPTARWCLSCKNKLNK